MAKLREFFREKLGRQINFKPEIKAYALKLMV